MARKKKKHVCTQCGESFNHGIGLRKHQRATQHKGSKIVDEGDEPTPEASAPEPESAPPQETPAAASASAPSSRRASRPSSRRAAAVEEEPDEEEHSPTVPVNQRLDNEPGEQTVAVQRTQVGPVTSTQMVPSQAEEPVYERTSRLAHNRQKLGLLRRALPYILPHLGNQVKAKAATGAGVLTEALKLAAALLCLLLIPYLVFSYWSSTRRLDNDRPAAPASFTFEDGPLAARSSLLRYLHDIGQGRLDEAYNSLSNAWQDELPEQSFRNAFLDISDLRWAVNDQKLLPDGRAEVSVILAFREGGRNQRFVGRFRLVQQGHEWKVDRAQLSPEDNLE